MASSPSSASSRSSAVGASEVEVVIATMLPDDEDIGTWFVYSNGEVMEKMPENPGFGSESCFDRGGGWGSSLISAQGCQPYRI